MAENDAIVEAFARQIRNDCANNGEHLTVIAVVLFAERPEVAAAREVVGAGGGFGWG